MSIDNVGQLFYGYGWEMMVLETGFLSIVAYIFPSRWSCYLFRWFIFRVIFGAGLIKIRGDQCWRDLTCMVYHYETQPNPGPLSWYFHNLPVDFHKVETAISLFLELPVPFLYFAPPLLRNISGILTIGFMATLILSGNLSFLNWLTIVITIPWLDDRITKRLCAKKFFVTPRWFKSLLGYAAMALVIYLSIDPTLNLMNPRQRMNSSFDKLSLVNTYGAFGSVGKVRNEIVLLGTNDKTITAKTKWYEYEFHCKPGDVHRRPWLITPYHYRLDW